MFSVEAKLEDDDDQEEDEEGDEAFRPSISIEKIQKQQRRIKQIGKLTKVSLFEINFQEMNRFNFRYFDPI